jgi:hypothetical protein
VNAARAALLQDAIDRQSGEDVLIEPMMPGIDANARPVPDTARSPATITGVWSEGPVEASRRPHERVESRNRDSWATRPSVKFQADALPYALAVGDRITRVATGERCAVAVPTSDGFGRVIAFLTARGKAS